MLAAEKDHLDVVMYLYGLGSVDRDLKDAVRLSRGRRMGMKNRTPYVIDCLAALKLRFVVGFCSNILVGTVRDEVEKLRWCQLFCEGCLLLAWLCVVA